MRTWPTWILAISVVGCSVQKSGSDRGASSNAKEEIEENTPDDDSQVEGSGPKVVKGNSGNLAFVAPANSDDIELSGGTYAVEVAFGSVSPTARWSLYYSDKKDSFLGGIAIIEELATTTSGVAWDVSFVEPGIYYLYAMLTDASVTTVHFAPAKFVLEGELSGNSPPSINLASPGGDVVYAPGEDVAITFTAADKDEDPFTIRIELTSDGTTWSAIADELSQETNQFTWTIPEDSPKTARYAIRVIADDGFNATTVQTEKDFGVNDTEVTYTNNVRSVLTTKCATSGCHSGAIPAQNLDVEQYNVNGTINGAGEVRQQILVRTRDGGGMPPAGSPDLTPEERDQIQFWLWNNGAQ